MPPITKQKCPGCHNYSIPITKSMVADLFGWAVKCRICGRRTSHSKWVRSLYVIITFSYFGGLIMWGMMPAQQFSLTQFILGLASLFCVILFLTRLFPLIERENYSNTEVLKQGRHEMSWVLWSCGILLICGGIMLWGSLFILSQLLTVSLLVGGFIFLLLALSKNWTI